MTGKPVRVWRQRTPGWRLPPGTVCVTRPSRFGNYVSLPREQTVEEYARAVEEYRRWLYAPEQALFREDVRHSLAGKDLACYCPPGLPCHADVLLELANS
jgi:hypothetical protein